MKFLKAFFTIGIFGSLLGTVGSIVGIGSGLNSLFGDSGGSQPSYSGGTGSGGPNLYQPTGLGNADQAYQQALAQLFANTQGTYGATAGPQLQSYNAMLGINPQGYAQAGQQAGQQYGNLAATAGQYAGQLGAQGMDAINRGGALWNAGADPQQQLFQRMQQQVQDQSRAGQSARGIAMSPYGAGLEQQAMSNFDIDWQNQQLQRMLSAGEGAMRQGQLAGADFTGAMQLGGQMPGYTQQAGAAPIQGQMQTAQFPGQAATTYAQQTQQSQFAPYQQILNQIVPYLNYGSGAGTNAYQAFSGQQNFNAGQQQQGAAALGQGLQQLGNNPSVSSWFGGGSTPAFDPNYASQAFSLDSGYGAY